MSKNKFETEKQMLISISLPPSILEKIDKLSGDIPRSAYLRKRIVAIVEKEVETVVQNGTFND